MTGAEKSRVGKNQRGRNQTVTQQTLLSIKISENEIKELCSLTEARFD